MTTKFNDVRATTFEHFLGVQLRAAHAADPARFRWPVEDAGKHAANMVMAMRQTVRGVSLDGPAMKAVLKSLNIKPTYKALADYLTGGDAYQAKPAKAA